jgi:hypothetical protein
MAPPFGWLTCLSPVGADPLEDRPVQVLPVRVAPVRVVPVQVVPVQVVPVQVVPVQVVPVQVAQVLAQAQRGHALVLQQANPVRPRPRTRPWLDRTLA